MAPNYVVFLLLVTSGCFGWQNLPAIPAGKRAEYYLLHDDGSYKYGYDTGDGHSHLATADASNQVTGKYRYVNQDGQLVNFDYRAGYEGFVPLGPSSSHGSSGGSGRSEFRKSSAGFGSSGSSSSAVFQGASVAPAHRLAGSATEFKDPDYEENSDASYSFQFDTPEYQRQESSDPQGNVRGQYSYVGKEGARHALSYVAGSGTGFVAVTSEGQSATGPAPSAYNAVSSAQGSKGSFGRNVYRGSPADVNSNVNSDGSYSFSYQTGDQSRQEVADALGNVQGRYSFVAKDGVQRSLDYSAGAGQGFVAHGEHLPKPEPVQGALTSSLGLSRVGSQYSQRSQGRTPGSTGLLPPAENFGAPVDASYSFQYVAGDHSRQESADPSGNIQGIYSFVADDGLERKVQYQAGAERGFVAQGAHLPQPGAVASVRSQSLSGFGYGRQSSPKSLGGVTSSSDGSYSLNYNVGGQSTFGQHSQVHSGGIGKSLVQQVGTGYSQSSGSSSSGHHHSEEPWDASYSFAYQADDHNRQEVSDPKGNVKGSYTFVADDGVQRSVNYIAGAEKGFIAQGDHIPQVGSQSAGSGGFARTGKAFQGSSQSSGFGHSHGSSAKSFSSSSDSDESGPASYSYSYDAGTSAKTESADDQGNVQGSFSYLGGDGVSRTLNYEAGGAKGFVASGAHLPQPPSAGASRGSPRALLTPPALSAPGVGLSKGLSSYSSSSIHSSATNVPLENFVIHRFLPPSNSAKFGYIFQESA